MFFLFIFLVIVLEIILLPIKFIVGLADLLDDNK